MIRTVHTSTGTFWDSLHHKNLKNKALGRFSFNYFIQVRLKKGDGASGVSPVCISTHPPTLVPLPWVLPPMDIHAQQLAPFWVPLGAALCTSYLLNWGVGEGHSTPFPSPLTPAHHKAAPAVCECSPSCSRQQVWSSPSLRFQDVRFLLCIYYQNHCVTLQASKAAE